MAAYVNRVIRMAHKIEWNGRLIGVQPRIRLTRSFDTRSHTYLGYLLHMNGQIGDERRHFSVGVGRAAHDKHQFEVGQVVTGQAQPVTEPNREPRRVLQSVRTSSKSAAGPSYGTAAVVGRATLAGGLSVSWTPSACLENLRHSVLTLHVGLPDAGHPDHRPLESQRPALPF